MLNDRLWYQRLAFVFLISLLQLSTAYITAWGILMLFIWQAVFILVVITYVFGRTHGKKDKTKDSVKYWDKTLMILQLWLCKCESSHLCLSLSLSFIYTLIFFTGYWTVLMFRTYKLYTKILQFKNNPQFIRQSAILIRRLSEANISRNRRSPPTVV